MILIIVNCVEEIGDKEMDLLQPLYVHALFILMTMVLLTAKNAHPNVLAVKILKTV
jgi:hypothetical protein